VTVLFITNKPFDIYYQRQRRAALFLRSLPD